MENLAITKHHNCKNEIQHFYAHVWDIARLFSPRLTLEGIHYLSPKPQLPSQVVMTNLLRELDREVSVGPVVGDTFIHDLIDNVQHIVLQMSTRVTENKIEQTS